MTDKPERKYKDSAEAYRAIHAVLSWEVDLRLESCEYSEAMSAAAMMREIEDHTDV